VYKEVDDNGISKLNDSYRLSESREIEKILISFMQRILTQKHRRITIPSEEAENSL